MQRMPLPKWNEQKVICSPLRLQLARVDEPFGHFHWLLLSFQILVPKPSKRTNQIQFKVCNDNAFPNSPFLGYLQQFCNKEAKDQPLLPDNQPLMANFATKKGRKKFLDKRLYLPERDKMGKILLTCTHWPLRNWPEPFYGFWRRLPREQQQPTSSEAKYLNSNDRLSITRRVALNFQTAHRTSSN